jgi:hypothetical protein
MKSTDPLEDATGQNNSYPREENQAAAENSEVAPTE